MAPSQAEQGTPIRVNPLREAEAFADFFSKNHLSVFRLIYALHGHPQETVEDLTAETFLRAWRARNKFSGDENGALRWVFRIARNLVIDTHRRASSRPEPEDLSHYTPPSSESDPEEQLVYSETSDRLLYAIGRLSTNQREMITLRYLFGWRVKDIAAHMEMQENTVSVNLRRALANLRSNWPTHDIKDGG